MRKRECVREYSRVVRRERRALFMEEKKMSL